ncbi:hypothetical protein BJ741DRAFT_566441 [Chytriomyces cf. hyalinus JEL632]|nr:hypothetical protein BJ741DRAFT_566441 [Chytriomyces cf. hyalinus JEL632]
MRKHSTESTSNTQLQHETSPSIVVFSGGSAANEIVSMIKSISYDVVYVMPVSDDGGSTSEIVKVVGGPGIGDIRSRLVRLSDTRSPEAKAVYDLLSYRLPTAPPLSEYHTSPAKLEWHTILEGNHPLWNGISLPYRETIRAFLLQFHYKILKEIGGGGLLNSASGEDNRSFDFRGGSLGNFFITGCRLFFDSLEAAIFQFARITRCPSETQVVPIVATNHNPVSIGVTLRNGGVIYGQCEISHPGTRTNPPLESSLSKSLDVLKDSPSANLFFSKTHQIPPLPSPIRRVFYINSERAETFPKLNALLPEHLETKKSIVYSMGSLYTSLLPCLVVAGGFGASADSDDLDKVKILLLNGTHDRETDGYTAMDFVLAITDVLNYSVIAEYGGGEACRKVMMMRDAKTDMDGAEASLKGRGYLVKPYPPRAYITHLLYAEDSQVLVEVERIGSLGIKCVMVPKSGTIASCDRESASLQNTAPSKHIKGHFGSEELRSVLEPLLL